MKKILIIVAVIVLLFIGYFVLGGNSNGMSSDKQNSQLTIALDKYESIINKYEKQGLKTQMDILQFSSDIQQWSSISWMPATQNVSQDELASAQKRLSSLQSRQMRMMKF